MTSTSSANGTLTATLGGPGVADVETNAASLSFGNVDVGTSSAAQTVTVTNYTNAAIALTSLSISGDYSETTGCGSTLAGLSSCTISVVFTPTATGARTGSLVLNTNDTRYPVLTVALSGSGVDFSLVASPTSGSLIAGFYENINLTVTPLGGFSAALTVSCSTTATGSACTPSQTSLTPTAATTVSVKIATTSQTTVISYAGLGLRGWMAFAGMGVAGLFAGRRRARLPALLLILLAASTMACGGCGSAPVANSNPTEPGTFTYTLTATDGVVVRSATYTLTVTMQ